MQVLISSLSSCFGNGMMRFRKWFEATSLDSRENTFFQIFHGLKHWFGSEVVQNDWIESLNPRYSWSNRSFWLSSSHWRTYRDSSHELLDDWSRDSWSRSTGRFCTAFQKCLHSLNHWRICWGNYKRISEKWERHLKRIKKELKKQQWS